MSAVIDPKNGTALRALSRLLQILGALLGRLHWPAPLDLRETIEELRLVFLKFG